MRYTRDPAADLFMKATLDSPFSIDEEDQKPARQPRFAALWAETAQLKPPSRRSLGFLASSRMDHKLLNRHISLAIGVKFGRGVFLMNEVLLFLFRTIRFHCGSGLGRKFLPLVP